MKAFLRWLHRLARWRSLLALAEAEAKIATHEWTITRAELANAWGERHQWYGRCVLAEAGLHNAKVRIAELERTLRAPLTPIKLGGPMPEWTKRIRFEAQDCYSADRLAPASSGRQSNGQNLQTSKEDCRMSKKKATEATEVIAVDAKEGVVTMSPAFPTRGRVLDYRLTARDCGKILASRSNGLNWGKEPLPGATVTATVVGVGVTTVKEPLEPDPEHPNVARYHERTITTLSLKCNLDGTDWLYVTDVAMGPDMGQAAWPTRS